MKSKKLELLEKERVVIFQKMHLNIENEAKKDLFRELFENSAQLNLEKNNSYKLNSRIERIKKILEYGN